MTRLIISTVILLFFDIAISQEILWERSIGGDKSDYLNDIKPTPDFGFILAGSSFSDDSGNKSGKRIGDLDYFLWKMDENGNQEWQKSFGGSGSDHLYSVNLTHDGGYILGGSSNSPISGDKKDASFGLDDFWVMKLNPKGEEEWQFTMGGKGMDVLLSIQQTKDKGYILGGTSDSSKAKDLEINPYQKSDDSRGGMDYWIVKITELGEIEWQKTIGGIYYDVLRSVYQTSDGGYVLGGYSNSPASGEKTEDNLGDGDYWIVKLNANGDIEWDKTFGGDGDDELFVLTPTNDKGFLIGGSSNSEISNTKLVQNTNERDWWLIKLSEKGDIQWQQTYDIDKNDILRNIIVTKENEYLLSGYSEGSLSDNQGGYGINDFAIIKIDEVGTEMWRKYIGGDDADYLEGSIMTRDGGFVLAGTSTSGAAKDKNAKAMGREDFWIVKILDQDSELFYIEDNLEVYPNPASEYVNVILHVDFKQADLQVFDMLGSLVLQTKLKTKLTPVDIRQLKTGSYVMKISVEKEVFTKKLLKR